MKRITHNGLIVLTLTFTLLIFGLVGIYSSSKVWAKYLYDDSFYYFKRQFIFILIGLILLFIGSRINKKHLYKYSNLLLLFGLILLILVLIPGIGVERNGSRSWFAIGSLAIQPAEIFKVCMIIYASKYLSSNYESSKKFYSTIIPLLIVTLIGFGLIMFQPDLGTGLVLVCSIVVMTLVSRVSFKNYIFLGVGALLCFTFVVISEPYRMSRITSYINPWEDPLGSGFQIIQAMYSIVPGGILGQGINNSIQKCFYLPEPQTDFIFAIMCEEIGLIGGLFIIATFILLFIYLFKIAFNSKSLFTMFLSIGVVSLIAIQVIINLGVVVGLLPVTGITLPFISYGGSSVTILLFLIGLVIGDEKESLDEDING